MDEEWVECDSFLHVKQPPPCGRCLGQGVLLGPEEGAGLAAHGHLLEIRGVLDRADEVGKLNTFIVTLINKSVLTTPHLAHDIGQPQGHEHGTNPAPDEPLPGLLGAELDERGAAHKEAEHVGHHVVDNHHHDGHDEPDKTL